MARDVNPYIPVHTTMPDHEKTRDLADDLDIPIPHAVGLVVTMMVRAVSLWPDGVIGERTSRRVTYIAQMLQWEGDRERLVDALIANRWIEEAAGGLSIRGWDDYVGRSLEKRGKNNERMRSYRAKLRGDTVAESGDDPTDVATCSAHGNAHANAHEASPVHARSRTRAHEAERSGAEQRIDPPTSEVDPIVEDREPSTVAADAAPTPNAEKPAARKQTRRGRPSHDSWRFVLADKNKGGQTYEAEWRARFPHLCTRADPNLPDRFEEECEAAWSHVSRTKHTDMVAFLRNWLRKANHEAERDLAALSRLRGTTNEPGASIPEPPAHEKRARADFRRLKDKADSVKRPMRPWVEWWAKHRQHYESGGRSLWDLFQEREMAEHQRDAARADMHLVLPADDRIELVDDAGPLTIVPANLRRIGGHDLSAHVARQEDRSMPKASEPIAAFMGQLTGHAVPAKKPAGPRVYSLTSIAEMEAAAEQVTDPALRQRYAMRIAEARRSLAVSDAAHAIADLDPGATPAPIDDEGGA